MKTARKTSKNSPKNIPDEYKSVDTSFVSVNSIKLSARTRNQQRKEIKANNGIPFEQIKENLSKLAAPRPIYQPPENNNWKITKNVLKYKASKRIQSLAQPKVIVPKAVDAVSTTGSFQSTVSLRALRYKPTARILELARPKNHELITDTVYESDDNDSLY